jgi:hypothetical protein
MQYFLCDVIMRLEKPDFHNRRPMTRSGAVETGHALSLHVTSITQSAFHFFLKKALLLHFFYVFCVIYKKIHYICGL